MTPAQTSLYFFHWGQVRKHHLARGIDPKQVDVKRHELHKRALGRDKSSKDFTNADLDKVIGAFRAVYDGGNLDAQLQQIDQPDNRRAAMVKQCRDSAATFIDGRDEAHKTFLIDRYLDGIADKMFGVQFARLDHGQDGHGQLAKVMGALARTARVRKEKREGNPF
jgi:hypothetical protein